MSRSKAQAWDQTTLGSIATFINGYAFASSEHDNSGLPVIRIEQLRDRDAHVDRSSVKLPGHFLLQNDDIVFSWSGSFIVQLWDRGPAWLNQHLFRVIPKDGVNNRFLSHMLNWSIDPLSRQSHGTTMTHVTRRSLLAHAVLLPPPEEQRRIAEVLDAADGWITEADQALRKQNSLSEALGYSLIPVEPNPQLLGADWDLVPLSEVVPTADYGISSPLSSEGDGMPTLRMNNLADGRVRLDDLKFATTAIPGELTLLDQDVLFNRTNSFEHVGRTAIWRCELKRATFASYLVRLNPDIRRLDKEYLVRWLNQPAIQQRIRRMATPGVHQVNINPTSLRRVPIELPREVSRQRQIVQIMANCDQAADRMRAELARLKSVRQGLMDDLLTGRCG